MPAPDGWRIGGRERIIAASHLRSLLATLEGPTPSFTVFELAEGMRLIGPPVDGVAALVVLSGTMYLGDGPSRQVARQGRVVLMPPGQRAQIGTGAAAPTHVVDGAASLVRRHRWLIADATRGRPARLVVAGTRIAGSAGEGLGAPVVASIADCAVGRPAYTMLRAEIARGADGHPALAASLMGVCVVQGLRRALDAVPDATGSATERDAPAGLIERAVAAVRARPADAHSVDTLADLAGMSRSTFTRHFRRVMRTTPADYVQRVRLDEARAMLRTTGLAIKAVAARTGFASRSHFSRQFRAVYGEDPSAFRTGPAPVPIEDGASTDR